MGTGITVNGIRSKKKSSTLKRPNDLPSSKISTTRSNARSNAGTFAPKLVWMTVIVAKTKILMTWLTEDGHLNKCGSKGGPMIQKLVTTKLQRKIQMMKTE